MMCNMEIAVRIKGLREAIGMSKSELARRCGVTTTAVWNWEENGRVPRLDAFARAAKALNVSETFLRTGVIGPALATSISPTRTVAVIIEDARNEIAGITGVPIKNVRLNVEFLSN